jgi:hypothetical protein
MMTQEKKFHEGCLNEAFPAQRCHEGCLADRGYRFVRKEGLTSVWQFTGLTTIVEVWVDVDGKEVRTEKRKR